jgi:hypothetical protein
VSGRPIFSLIDWSNRTRSQLGTGGPQDSWFIRAILRQRMPHTSRVFSLSAMCGNEDRQGLVSHLPALDVFFGCYVQGRSGGTHRPSTDEKQYRKVRLFPQIPVQKKDANLWGTHCRGVAIVWATRPSACPSVAIQWATRLEGSLSFMTISFFAA